MDMQMPRMDGLEAAERIRALPLGGSVPIVAISASALDIDRTACLAAGPWTRLGSTRPSPPGCPPRPAAPTPSPTPPRGSRARSSREPRRPPPRGARPGDPRPPRGAGRRPRRRLLLTCPYRQSQSSALRAVRRPPRRDPMCQHTTSRTRMRPPHVRQTVTLTTKTRARSFAHPSRCGRGEALSRASGRLTGRHLLTYHT